MSDEKTTAGVIGAIMIGISKLIHFKSAARIAAVSDRVKKLEDLKPVGSDTLRFQVSAVAASVNKAERQLREDVGRIETRLNEHMTNSNANYQATMKELSELKDLLLQDALSRAQR